MSSRGSGVTARNPKAVQRSRREREEIRRVWLDLETRWPFERHTAKDIARRLPFRLALSTIYWHMEQIRIEALKAEAANDSGALKSFQCIE
jgi:hypothetical protein